MLLFYKQHLFVGSDGIIDMESQVEYGLMVKALPFSLGPYKTEANISLFASVTNLGVKIFTLADAEKLVHAFTTDVFTS